jgi:uncharacterized protein YndB with AHSA1/START domain
MSIPDQIEREVVINAPVQRVWTLITEPEHLGTWFGDAGAEIDLRPGGELTMSWEEHGTVHARIERVEPERLFSYRWAPFQDPGGVEPAEGNSTLVEFTLATEGEATRLRVVESGFHSLEASDDLRRELHEGNVEGWQIELGHLAEHAARVTA